MTEAAAEGEIVLLQPCILKSCDTIRCPSPLPCAELQSNQKEEVEQQKLCSQLQPKRKMKPRGKLVRSMAVCDDDSQVSPDTDAKSSESCQEGETTLAKEEEEQEKSADPKKHPLPKESSGEYTDSTGIDLHQFIVDTLNSNPRDRMMLLKLEQDMIDFITSNSPFKKFPHMSSYHRMLVHRVAAYFGMEHNVDQTGKSVIINRTSSTRIPDQRFLDAVHKDKTDEMHHWKAILKRDNSLDSKARLQLLREKQSKSVEEREEEYQRARDRIFSQEPLGTQENTSAEIRAAEEYNPYAETQRRRQLFRGSRDSSGSSWTGSSRQSSMEADGRYSNDPRPWSSTDSDSSYHWSNPPTAKPRQAAAHTWDTRGSGTVTLFRVSSTCPHPSSPPILEEPDPNSAYIMDNGIPPGSILVNPHTGQPFLNPDGTPAVYNPPDSQQPIRSQAQQQVVQCSSVSYAAPQVLPVAPSQPFTTIEDLSSQFAHVTVSCQSTGEAPPLYPPAQGYLYAAPPPPSNPPSYCQPQVPLYYYGQYPTSAQHLQSQHGRSQAAQQTAGCAPAAGMQQPSYGQAQAMLGAYSPLASHQCSMVQGGMTSFPHSKLLTGIGGEAAYCCMVPPPHASCTNLSTPAWSAQY